MLRKASDKGLLIEGKLDDNSELNAKETQLLKLVKNYPNVVSEAGKVYSPAVIANYAYDLAKEFNQFYHEIPIVFEEDEAKRNMRLALSKVVGNIIKQSMWLLGIDVPERM